MILSGDKKEEYREIKPYWIKRLTDGWLTSENAHLLHAKRMDVKEFDVIRFKNGYSKGARAMTVKWEGLRLGEPVKEWSGGFKGEVFIISIGEVVDKEGC